jgi:hypothetical protein
VISNSRILQLFKKFTSLQECKPGAKKYDHQTGSATMARKLTTCRWHLVTALSTFNQQLETGIR